MKITLFNHLTLDGVMQSPAAPDEDTRGGFTEGGWATRDDDPVLGEFIGTRMSQPNGGLLLGRRTYEHFYEHWPKLPDHPFTKSLESSQKYVASTTATELPWLNTIVLEGDAGDAVAKMKAAAPDEAGHDLVLMGSGELAQSLMRRDLIDEFVLLVHPVVLGTGRRLFAEDGTQQSLELEASIPTTTGVLITTYRLAA
jgi:dihydrofolate reductase